MRAFRRQKPLVVLLGEGRIGPRLVIDAFLERIDDEIDVIRLNAPKTNAVGCTRSIVEALGFETNGLEPPDLGQILTMFLAYQKTHRRRTLICLEDAQDAGGWALDELSALVSRELRERHGLQLLLAGRKNLDDRLRLPAFDVLGDNADPRISLSPYDLAETRLYLKRFVEAKAGRPVADIIEFDAITRVYEISDGVPEFVEHLVTECLLERRGAPISTSTVEAVAARLRFASPGAGSAPPRVAARDGGQLVARSNGRFIGRWTIEREKLKIGRDVTADLRLTGTNVSRMHALLEWTHAGVQLIDLGSTNGTWVDGERIQSAWLGGECRIRIGNVELLYRPSASNVRPGMPTDRQAAS